MDFSVRWLRRYIDTELDADRIAEVLTDQGLTVDEIRQEANDTILDIDVTTNRPDAMNYVGLARELATSEHGKLNLPVLSDFKAISCPTADMVTVDIQDPDLCGRYVARYVKNVKVGPSPQWMQDLLDSAGIHAINNVVDITNFVLWELGHPLHAFDSRFVEGNQIIVRRAKAGEQMTTLDGVERKLISDDLVIADANRPIALAGVMGGENSEIREDTTDVVIESAWFDPASVRKTSKRYALHTDASYRFERGADINMAMFAADRVAGLLVELAGGAVCRDAIDAYPVPHTMTNVLLKKTTLHRILGVDVSNEFVHKTLAGLGFKKLEQHSEGTVWEVPSCRLDVTREIDLVEEVARMYGYNNLDATLPAIESPGRVTSRHEHLLDEINRTFVASGFNEAISYSFCSRGDNTAISPQHEQMIELANPISETMSVMRTSLLSTLVGVAALNIRRGNRDLKLFETGKAYFPAEIRCDEQVKVAAVATKGASRLEWTGRELVVDEFVLKGIVMRLGNLFLGGNTISFKTCESPAFKPDAAATLYFDGQVIGHIGELSDNTLNHFDTDTRLVALELNLAPFVNHVMIDKRVKPFSMMPGSERDSAFMLDRSIPYSEISSFLDGLKIPVLKDVKLFDRYEGKGVPDGKVSIAINFFFQADDRTLNNDEVNALHQQIVTAFLERFEAELR